MSEYSRPDYAAEARRFNRRVMLVLAAAVFTGATLIVGTLGVYPIYRVYAERMRGRAELQRAESNRQIRVVEAQAALEAADMTSRAEVKRAEGVAASNAVIANGLGGPEGYLRWRYIEMLENSGKDGRDVIYVPTEAGLPILEAGKRP